MLWIVILSLLLFLSLSVFGPAFLVNRTVLNPSFVASEVNRLEIASLIEDSIAQQTPEELPPEIGDSISKTITKLEPQLKKELNNIIYSIYDYLLGKRESPELATVLRNTLLNSNFIAPIMDELDISPLLKPILQQQLAAWVPEEMAQLTSYLDQSIDTILAEQESWIKEQIKAAADPIADYLVGKSNSFSIAISTEPIIDSVKASLLNDFMESPLTGLAQLVGLSPESIETSFNQLFDQFSQAIPKTIEIDETLIGKDTPAQITASLAEMEQSLSQVRDYVKYFQLGYVLLIIFMVLLIGGIILIYREVRGSTRTLGIIFLTVGVIELTILLLVKHLLNQQIAQVTSDVPKQLQTWLPQLLDNIAAPLQMLTIGLIIGGTLLIVVHFLYRPNQTTKSF